VISLGLVLLVGGPLAAEEQLSPRNANYEISVDFSPEDKTLTGSQVLTWTNIQQRPTRELWFHLYWNAWRNDRSTWMTEDRIRGRSSNGAPRPGDWSSLEVDTARLLAGEGWEETDLIPTFRFVTPDDENRHDRTVAVVTLPREVQPGETVRVEMDWRARIPRTFARTGYRGNFYFIAHWFPKLGVFEADGWNCHQYHSATEYYSDYGVYDVRIKAPEGYVVGATGRQIEQRDNGDGTWTHRFEQADVHAFTWTASPDYLVEVERFEEPGLPPVDIRLLYQPEHRRQVERHFDATKAALKYYGTWFGPYPYGHVTVVDPAYGAGAGGMEYPTLFTSGTRLFNPFGGGSPEGVTIHEAGHQFWYGIVGNNEFEHAWIDEGFNSFADARTYDAAYGDSYYVKRYFRPPGTGQRGFLPVLFPDLNRGRDHFGNGMSGFRHSPTTEVMAKPTWRYFPSKAGTLSYSKTALWLATLENYLGWETLQQIMSTFFERYKFDHPSPEEFFVVADEVSGQDLGWFWEQVYYGSSHFDYAIESVTSRPLDIAGLVGDEGALELRERGGEAAGETTTYRSEVVARREGDATFPVDVLLVFEDGTESRHAWDGLARWTMIVEERTTKLHHAIVDPDRVLLLDVDRSNNSRLVEAQAGFPATKLAAKWIVWLQDFLTTFAFFS
jgi:hypothetical protein